jgi:hypothetical protein
MLACSEVNVRSLTNRLSRGDGRAEQVWRRKICVQPGEEALGPHRLNAYNMNPIPARMATKNVTVSAPLSGTYGSEKLLSRHETK